MIKGKNMGKKSLVFENVSKLAYIANIFLKLNIFQSTNVR